MRANKVVSGLPDGRSAVHSSNISFPPWSGRNSRWIGGASISIFSAIQSEGDTAPTYAEVTAGATDVHGRLRDSFSLFLHMMVRAEGAGPTWKKRKGTGKTGGNRSKRSAIPMTIEGKGPWAERA